jgi:Arylsulfotransferase (ASST)
MAHLSRRSVLLGAGALGLAGVTSIGAREVAARLGTQGPRMSVTRHEPGTASGRIMFTYDGGAAIADASGTSLWTTSGAGSYTNLQVQQYRRQRVFTWWQGTGGPGGGGTGTGTDVVTSLAHAPVARIGPLDGNQPDAHELLLTTTGTALITSYAQVPCDLSVVGGPAAGQVLNGYCEEVDIASGTVLHRWSALEHVPLTDSFLPVTAAPGQPYDFFHINSISVTPDRHLLVSARHTCALYKIHRTTGQVLWRLGGKSSSFSLAADAVFGFQHHAAYEDPHTIRMFDNGSDGLTTLHPSRVAWIRLDTTTMTATLATSMTVPDIQSAAMGSAQRLPNGNVFVSWGNVPRLTEFSPHGDVLFDATLTFPSYRAFKFDIP